MALDALSIRQKAVAIGIDNDQFQGCLKSGAKDRIERDLVQARDLGITSTPSFLIGILRPDRTLKSDPP